MRHLKLTLAYDGTAYAGWQVQPDRPTVQAVLERALTAVTSETIRAVASGRTDAGVHALGQVVSCATASALPADVLTRALNANLPVDVRVLQVAEAPERFHAVRDAIGKTYRYVIQDGGVPDVFDRHYCWYLPRPLDVAAMSRAAQALVGKRDFASFQAAGSERASTVRTVRQLTVERSQAAIATRVVMEVAADGFLYNMVRNIVGTLVQVGRGAQRESWVAEVLTARDRKVAGITAPPQGLFLVCVEYDH